MDGFDPTPALVVIAIGTGAMLLLIVLMLTLPELPRKKPPSTAPPLRLERVHDDSRPGGPDQSQGEPWRRDGYAQGYRAGWRAHEQRMSSIDALISFDEPRRFTSLLDAPIQPYDGS